MGVHKNFSINQWNVDAHFHISNAPRMCVLGDEQLDSEGRGGLALLVGTDYLFSSRTRPEYLFPG